MTKDLLNQSRLAVLASLNRNLDIRPLYVMPGFNRELTEVYHGPFEPFNYDDEEQQKIHDILKIPKGNYSIDHYSGSGSVEINHALWEHFKNGENIPNHIQMHINALDRIMKPESIHSGPFSLYTGLPKSPISLAGSEWSKDREHKLMYFPSFVSTSIDAERASLFTDNDEETQHHESDHHGIIKQGSRHILQLHYPKGIIHSAASVMPHAGNKHEREVLLGRGHEYTLHPRPTELTTGGFDVPVYVWHATYGPRRPNPIAKPFVD